MSFSVDVLAKIAIELQTGIGHQDRFQRLISTLRHVLACDASALLRYEGRQFIPRHRRPGEGRARAALYP